MVFFVDAAGVAHTVKDRPVLVAGLGRLALDRQAELGPFDRHLPGSIRRDEELRDSGVAVGVGGAIVVVGLWSDTVDDVEGRLMLGELSGRQIPLAGPVAMGGSHAKNGDDLLGLFSVGDPGADPEVVVEVVVDGADLGLDLGTA